MRSPKIGLLAGMIVFAVGCRPQSGSSTPGSTTAAPSSPAAEQELALAQGTWLLVKAELPPNDRLPSPIDLKQIEGTVKGNLLAITIKDEQSRHFFVISVDPTTNPKQIELIESSSVGDTKPRELRSTGPSQPVLRTTPRNRFAGIYKVDGETLVVAWASMPGGPRPTEFKAKDALKTVGDRNATTADLSGVKVVYLRKK